MDQPIVYIVHCVDAEGPLNETLEATFERLEYIFGIKLEPTIDNLALIQSEEFSCGNLLLDAQIKTTFSKSVLNYNRNFLALNSMNDKIFDNLFRREFLDSFDAGWKITWFCLDHLNYNSNPREKVMGFSEVFRYYKKYIDDRPGIEDELQWHFHPKSLTSNPLAAATSYVNNMQEILEIFARKIIDDGWFPSAFRPGFHAERQDSNLFLEQWIPFDFGNQFMEAENEQQDMLNGRFGNWSKAPSSWRGYHPSVRNYDIEGELSRTIYRCLNLGTRLRLLNENHVLEAFHEASTEGNAILAFTNHDFRDIEPDIRYFYELVKKVQAKFPHVKYRFCTAEEAAQNMIGRYPSSVELECTITDNVFSVWTKSGQIFGSQPFLALRSKSGEYFHDNLDQPSTSNLWTYTFDEQTIELASLSTIGVGCAGKFGGYSTCKIDL